MSNIGRGSVRVANGAPLNVVLFQNSARTPVWPGAPGGESTDDGIASGPWVRSAGAGRDPLPRSKLHVDALRGALADALQRRDRVRRGW